MKPLRVAFPLIPSRVWMGGFNYVLNLIGALVKYEGRRIRPVVYCGLHADAGDEAAFRAIPSVEVVRDAAFDPDGRRQGLRSALLTGVDGAALACFRRHRIDVLFESANFFGWRFPLPAIAWLPDFQHRRMPELFSKGAWWRRELGFRAQILARRTVLLSSEDSRRDCARLYPRGRGSTAVLPFPAVIDPRSLSADPTGDLAQYGLPDRFVFLPNHFWKHKNHQVAIEALGMLRAAGKPLTIVATGNPADPRHPGHLDRLRQRARELGVDQDFRILESVPRTHVVALMRTCSVLLNPSRCEGWSTTVEEAKALGVPMLLSDLNVHREQTVGLPARFFAPDDSRGLADLLDEFGRQPPSQARALGPAAEARVEQYAQAFAGIVADAVQRWHGMRVEA